MASRIVLTKKKCGDYRVCIDYRQLNKMVLKDCFPVPVIDDVLLKLQKAKIFVVMDLENGFFHVPIQEDSRKYTAFITKQGLYEFNRAPFGFSNSPANFIRYISYIFQNLINSDVMELYIDDTIIYGETAEECLNKLKLVLNTAARFDLKFKWSKYSFLKNRIEFLGHNIENGSISPSKAKTKAVQKFPVPKNIKDVQAFLGLTGYFRKFGQGYAHIAKPLTNLLKKGVPFQITCRELSSTEQLKLVITSEPVLKIYSRNARTELHTDASKEGFGATLLQVFDEQLHPVFYWSKRDREDKRQWTIRCFESCKV